MTAVFISDFGDDKNDGCHEDTPIYSWARSLKLKSGHDQIRIVGNVEAIIARLKAEIDARNKRSKKA
jgi:hypothetical protein